MGKLVLCCGKVCSGKSTFSEGLKERYGFYHFSADTWMLHFYEETTDRELFDSRLQKCISMIYRVTETILSHQGDVVLDFGYWKRSDRVSTRKHFESLGHEVDLVYFPIARDLQLGYMRKRQDLQAQEHYDFSEETVTTLNQFFEEPDQTELVVTKEEYVKKLGRPLP